VNLSRFTSENAEDLSASRIRQAGNEPFEEKMARLTAELSEQFGESKRLEDEIRKNIKGLGFDV